MSTDTTPTRTRNSWIIALLVSIAVNGLLIGLLLSKQTKPSRDGTNMPSFQGSMQIAPKMAPSDPRYLVRILEPARRKQVMKTAMKNLKLQGTEHPRHLFKKLRQAKFNTMRLLRADELDIKAVELSLAEIRTLNQKLAISGDALMIEVLQQLTPAERKAAERALKNREKNRRRRIQRRR